MRTYALQHGIGDVLTSVNALTPNVVTAGTTDSGAAQNGNTIDRQSLGRNYLSAQIAIPVTTTLAATKTLTVAAKVQDSADGTNFTDYGTAPSSTVLGSTSSTASQTLKSAKDFNVDISSARRYVRVVVTPTLSATASDTVALGGVAVLGGGDRI